MTELHPVYSLMKELEDAGVYFNIHRLRDDSISIHLTIIGQRIEVEVFEDGHIEYSVFKGNEDVISDTKYLMAEIKNWKNDS